MSSTLKKYLPVFAALGLLGAAAFAIYVNRDGSGQGSAFLFFLAAMGFGAGLLLGIYRPPLKLIHISPHKLPASEELFSIFLEGVNDGIFDWNLDNNTINYASSYKNILGYTAEELGPTHDGWRKCTHPDDSAAAIEISRRYANREIPKYHNVFRMRHKDGHWVWIQSRAVGVWDENGKMRRMVGVHTDITEQKLREDMLRSFAEENRQQRMDLEIAKERAEAANQAKSDFLATMSHEIRTPLNVIIGMSQLLRSKLTSPEKREMIDVLHSNADLLSKLVNDLLDLSRIESTGIEIERQPFRLADILHTVETMFESETRGKGIAFGIDNSIEPATFIGDALRMQQILVNLVGNALKFTSQGSITITASGERRGEAMDVAIAVTDTGVGIPDDKLATVFDKFMQADQTISRRFGGSGLGLAICKSLATLMGGDITVESAVGKGSTFTLRVPFALGEMAAAGGNENPVEPEETLTHGTVLLVEDYPANVIIATLMLEKLGYGVVTASSGAEALDILEKRDEPFAAILMDVQMPGMDGFKTTGLVRALEKRKGIRNTIIGVTAHAMAEDRARCLDAGMDEYISKPIDLNILERKLQRLDRAA